MKKQKKMNKFKLIDLLNDKTKNNSAGKIIVCSVVRRMK